MSSLIKCLRDLNPRARERVNPITIQDHFEASSAPNDVVTLPQVREVPRVPRRRSRRLLENSQFQRPSNYSVPVYCTQLLSAEERIAESRK